jgi:transposase
MPALRDQAMEEEAMEVLHPRCAGLDVHEQFVVACVRIAEGTQVRRETCRFGTTTRELVRLLEWLLGWEVTHVAMESTGVYWKPVWHVLEGSFELVLGNAKEMRNVPGRKTDQSDASWIADLLAHGLIRPSLVPPEPVQELRDLTRTRKQLVRQRTQHVQRLQKVLQDANIKLASVLSDLQGESGRAILRAIAAGEDDPHRLASLAHPRVKAAPQEIVEALEGRVREHHRFMLRLHLDQIDALDRVIGAVDARIEAELEPFRCVAALLDGIPGYGEQVIPVFIAETGGDMEVFATDDHLVSWAGCSPQKNESAGKRKNSRTRRTRWLKAAMVQAAKAAIRKPDSYLRAKYLRLKARRGSKKATLAIAATLLRIAYHVLKTGQPYREAGAAAFSERDRERTARHLAKRLAGLGYEVELKLAA